MIGRKLTESDVQKIKDMRMSGMSVKDIWKNTEYGLATVSKYCKGLREPNPGSGYLHAYKATHANKLAWDRRKAAVRKEAAVDFDYLKKDPDWMFFIGLYWGEGNKRASSVGIANGDVDFLRICYEQIKKLTDKEIRLEIRYYEDHDPDALLKEWSSRINADRFNIRKITDPRSGKKKGKLVHGIGYLKVDDWKLKNKIMTWIDLLRGHGVNGSTPPCHGDGAGSNPAVRSI